MFDFDVMFGSVAHLFAHKVYLKYKHADGIGTWVDEALRGVAHNKHWDQVSEKN